MAYFRYTVPMDGAVAAMLRLTVPVYCFKHGVWMGLRTDVGDRLAPAVPAAAIFAAWNSPPF
jgi:hypothetical protein